ncbi:glycoside hydrolase family 16 protein, partial [Phenylobacterium sp.]|uniref:glycoside hydrolase family 16 protein n=1 Tax=Phenylobacterium sp. TaxID=1871053 RepID=UPI002D807FBF
MPVFEGSKVAIDPNNLAGTAKLTFDDEFNSLSLWNGTSGWYTNYNFNGSDVATFSGNGELEWYINASNPNTTSVKPWAVSNGILTLTAAPADPSIQPFIDNYHYTSGVLTSQFSFSQLYGYFEISAKLPAGQGFWPAFWLLPTDNSNRPEIDIFEVLGSNTTSLWQFSHTADVSFDAPFNNTVADMSTGFHRYGVDWEPDKITFYFDGHVMGVANTAPEDDVPMYMLMNLAVGGTWGGAPDATTNFPGQYQIDYVRVYQSNAVSTSTTLSISPTSVSHAEGDTGSTAFVYTLTRSGDLTGTSAVNWSVAGSGTNA